MIICHSRANSLSQWDPRSDMQSQVSSFKYLGVTITNNLSRFTHITNITSKALSNKTDINKLERVQRQSAKFIMADILAT